MEPQSNVPWHSKRFATIKFRAAIYIIEKTILVFRFSDSIAWPPRCCVRPKMWLLASLWKQNHFYSACAASVSMLSYDYVTMTVALSKRHAPKWMRRWYAGAAVRIVKLVTRYPDPFVAASNVRAIESIVGFSFSTTQSGEGLSYVNTSTDRNRIYMKNWGTSDLYHKTWTWYYCWGLNSKHLLVRCDKAVELLEAKAYLVKFSKSILNFYFLMRPSSAYPSSHGILSPTADVSYPCHSSSRWSLKWCSTNCYLAPIYIEFVNEGTGTNRRPSAAHTKWCTRFWHTNRNGDKKIIEVSAIINYTMMSAINFK